MTIADNMEVGDLLKPPSIIEQLSAVLKPVQEDESWCNGPAVVSFNKNQLHIVIV